MVVASDERTLCESTLERLRFAVAAFPEADPALAALSWFSPDVVVIDRGQASAFREAVPVVSPAPPPVVEFSQDVESVEAVVEAIRVALRATMPLRTEQKPLD